jgi:hypothetical protein
MFHDECFGLGTQIFEVAVAGVEIVEVDDLDLDALDGPKFPDGWNGFVYAAGREPGIFDETDRSPEQMASWHSSQYLMP